MVVQQTSLAPPKTRGGRVARPRRDLNIAMKEAVRETVALLQAKAGVTAAEAYAIASMGVDFRVGEAVDSMLMVYGVVPKKFFKQTPEYWRSK